MATREEARELTQDEVVQVEFAGLELAGKLMEEVGLVLGRHLPTTDPAVMLTAIQNLGVLLLGAAGGSGLAAMVKGGQTAEEGVEMLHKLARYHSDKAGRIIASLVPRFIERWDELAAMSEQEFAQELGRDGMYLAVDHATGKTYSGFAGDNGARH